MQVKHLRYSIPVKKEKIDTERGYGSCPKLYPEIGVGSLYNSGLRTPTRSPGQEKLVYVRAGFFFLPKKQK